MTNKSDFSETRSGDKTKYRICKIDWSTSNIFDRSLLWHIYMIHQSVPPRSDRVQSAAKTQTCT